MSDHNTTVVRDTGRSKGTLAFIVGGVVVAVGFILWLVLGSGIVGTPTGAGNGAGDTNTSVTIEAPAADAPAPTVPTAPEAAPAPVAPAPGN